MSAQIPAAGASVVQLTQIEVFFSEDVQGVDATDLMVGGVAATNVLPIVPSQYRFQFAQPVNGTVLVSWTAGSGITDLAANAFAGGSWTYTLDPSLAFNSIRINEFMADNDTGIRDEDGDSEDWIELYNGGTIPVNLDGCFLTDDKSELDLWRFPAFTMAPNTYLIIWASAKDRTDPVAPLHTNFRLDPDTGYVAFVGPQTNVISDFGLSYPQQRTDVSYGRDPLDPNTVGYYPGTNASPGRINTTVGSGADFAPDVFYSRDSGTFVEPFSLALSTPSPNAVIRYVLVTNAATASASVTNVPTASSPIYSGPIPINLTTVVRARAFETGKLPGTPASKIYIQIDAGLRSFSSDLPIVIVHNFAQSPTLPNSADQGAVLASFHADLDRSSLTNAPDLAIRMGVNDRGSSTGGQARQNMAAEFWDEFNQDIDYPLVGMPEESDWVFYGINGFDPGMMHNAIFHWFGRAIGRYSSRTRFVEVFRKTSPGPITTNDYFGLFLVEEKPKRNKNRVDIEAIRPENTNAPSVTGGWLLRIDRQNDPGEVGFRPPAIGNVPTTPEPITYVDPDGVRLTTDIRLRPQTNYIQNYILNFLTNLSSANYKDPVTGYASYIDVDSWVENNIANVICYNVDGYRLSGYFFKDRNKRLEQGPPWDCDRCLGTGGGGGGQTPQGDNRCFNPREWRRPATALNQDNGTDFFGLSTVGVSWWAPLFRDPDFWQRWIDRYQAFRTNEFTTNAVFAMIDDFHDEIKEAQARDQARWSATFTYPRSGNHVNVSGYSYNFGPANPQFARGGYFSNEVNFQKQWLADRLDFIDTIFLAMPILSMGDSLVSTGTVVTVTRASKPGTLIYYTLDGTDPRLPGGAISSSALSMAGNLSLVISTNVRLFARCFNLSHSNLYNVGLLTAGTAVGRPLTNSHWSGPVAASYYTSVPPLRVTELMYHPANPPAGDTNDPDNFEYIEVRNIGATPLNVNRFRLRGGVDFDFPNTLLPVGGRAVIVRDAAAFTARYGGGITILGSYTNNNLGNDGDRLILEGGLREPILDFEYDDDWYPITDGPGFSLEIVNDSISTTNWSLKASWRPSGTVGGTPGAGDPGAPVIPAVYVSEALTKTDPIPADAIELYNSTGASVDIGGWYLTDDFGTPQKYRIPSGTSIPANSYVVFYQSNSFGVGSNAFALSSRGDEVYLFSGNANSNLTGWVHGFDYGAQVYGATFGRHIISTAEEHFVTQINPTLGSANSGPKVGPIVISEINYHPPDFTFPLGSVDNEVDEYIELQNISGAPAPLYDTANPSNTWRLRDAVSFTFPQGVTLPPGGFLLVVGFTPTNGPALDKFRAANGVPVSTPIYGPWSGKLDNSGDNVELIFPDVPDAPGTPSAGFVPYVLADKVDYRDLTPWPQGLADGLGGTLHRNPASGYGNDPANWSAAVKTPGATIAGGVLPVIVTQPVNTVGVGRYSATFTVAATGTAPLAYQWTFNSNAIYGATGPTLTLNNLRLNQAGTYACYVFNGAGFVLSSNAQLTVLSPVTVTGNPQSVRLRGSTNASDYGFTTNNVTFTASVATQRPTRYQWHYNGGPLENATNVSVTISNVDFDLHEGEYFMTATDNLSADVTQPARLTVLLSPTLVEVPPRTNGPPILVASNGSFSASVVIRGNPPPFYYRWNEGSTTRVGATNDLRTNTMSYGPITNYVQRLWRVIVTNEANVAPTATSPFFVAALIDSDGDGIPDDWENQYNFNANSDTDRNLDSDGDGAGNFAEYFAGTNPTNAASFLRVNLAVNPGQAQIQVGVVSNRTYSVQYSDDLGLGLWQTLGTVLSQTNSRTETLIDPGWTSNRFYRAVTPAQSP